SLDDLVHAHREVSIPVNSYVDADDSEAEADGEAEARKADAKTMLLGEANWRFATPDNDIAIEKDAARLPLREVWDQWFADRPNAERDADGLELLRASGIARAGEDTIKGGDDDAPKWLRQAAVDAHGGLKPVTLKYA